MWQRTTINRTYQLPDEELTAILDYVDSAFPTAKDFYKHRKMNDEELNLMLVFLQQVSKDSNFEAYSHILDSVQHL